MKKQYWQKFKTINEPITQIVAFQSYWYFDRKFPFLHRRPAELIIGTKFKIYKLSEK